MRSFTWKAGDVRVHFSVKEAQEWVLFDDEGVINIDKVRAHAYQKLVACKHIDDEILIPYCVTTSQPRESFKVKDRTEIDLILKKIKVIRELIQIGPTPALHTLLKKLKERYDELCNA